MAEQIATMRYRMNAFMFWFMIFFLPPAKFRFFLFPQISLRRSTLRNDSFRGLESWFHYFCFQKSLAVRESWLFSCFPVLPRSLLQAFFISPIREIFFSNWASDFARFLNHDAKIQNPVLLVVRQRAMPCDSGTFFSNLFSSCSRKLGQIVSAMLDSCSLLQPESATRQVFIRHDFP